MRFEERELKPYAESILVTDLTEGTVYFMVNFIDDELLIPQMMTMVYIGKNLGDEETDAYYFHDIGTYQEGIPFDPLVCDSNAIIFKCSINELNGIYDFENALEILMGCSLRRMKASK